MSDHLNATLIELVSVIAAKKVLKEPIKVPRPGSPNDPREVARRQQEQQAKVLGGKPENNLDAAFKQGIGVLAATSKRVDR